MSRCIWSRESPDSLSVVMHERKGVFIRFNPLNDLSAEHVVTGKVHMIRTSALTFGNIEVVCLRAILGVPGKLASPCCCCCFTHFIFQQCSSLWMQSEDGRSPMKLSANFITVVLYSSSGSVTMTEGTIHSPSNAIW